MPRTGKELLKLGYDAELPVIFSSDRVVAGVRSAHAKDSANSPDSVLNSLVLKAVDNYLKMIGSEDWGGIAVSSSGEDILAEIPEVVDGERCVHVIHYRPASGIVRAVVLHESGTAQTGYTISADGNDGKEVLTAMIPVFRNEDEFDRSFCAYRKQWENSFPEHDEAIHAAALLCDNVSCRLNSDRPECSPVKFVFPITGTFVRLALADLENGSLWSPDMEIVGKFQYLRGNIGTSESTPSFEPSQEPFAGMYCLNENRKLSEEELALVPVLDERYGATCSATSLKRRKSGTL